MNNTYQAKVGNEKIPIVYVLDNFYRGGGTENQLYNLIENLDRDRFTPYVFNLCPKWPDKSIDVNCDVFYLNVESPLSINALKAVFKIAKFIKEKNAKILQVYFIDSRMIAVLAGRLAGIKRIVFCRRDGGYWHGRTKLLFMMRQFSKLAHYGLVNAVAIKKMVSFAELFPAEKIEVIYNGVELKPSENEPAVSRSDFGIPDDVPVIGHVANLRQIKRIDRLIKAAAMMKNKNAHFLIIGTGPKLDELKELADNLGISERIHFHFIEGVNNLLKIIDIGVLASQSEALSNVLIEYALAGCPSVAFDVGGNNEIISNGETGYIIQGGSEKKLAVKLDYLIENPEIAKNMGKKAAEIAADKFNMKKMVSKTEDFYTRILNDKSLTREKSETSGVNKMRRAIKVIVHAIFYILVLPLGLTAKICKIFLGTDIPFHTFAEGLSLVPGPFGMFIRAGFYKQTLKKAPYDMVILFGSHFTKIDSVVGRNIKIGGHSTVGYVHMGENAIIANGVNILSGRYQHNFDDTEKSVLDGEGSFACLYIGKDAFIGDSSTVMANVGDYSLVGAGSIVVKDIPEYSVAVGNPARVVKERPRPDDTAIHDTDNR